MMGARARAELGPVEILVNNADGELPARWRDQHERGAQSAALPANHAVATLRGRGGKNRAVGGPTSPVCTLHNGCERSIAAARSWSGEARTAYDKLRMPQPYAGTRQTARPPHPSPARSTQRLPSSRTNANGIGVPGGLTAGRAPGETK